MQYAYTDYTGCPYITAGKRYEIKRWDGGDGRAFFIECEQGHDIWCRKSNCGHLHGRSWTVIDDTPDTRLRDEFAMAALTGLLTDPICALHSAEVAADAYRYADAMLEARKR
jgi:hypothetical protein